LLCFASASASRDRLQTKRNTRYKRQAKSGPGRAAVVVVVKKMFAAISAVAHVAFFITATDIRYDGD
jgi:hypothetical protein